MLGIMTRIWKTMEANVKCSDDKVERIVRMDSDIGEIVQELLLEDPLVSPG